MRKVLGWVVAILAILIPLALLGSLEFLKAWADKQNVTGPDWLTRVMLSFGALITVGTAALLLYAFFGKKGRAVRAEHREKMRRLKNFELDGD